MLWNVLSRRMPALLMTMSTVPNASTAVLTIASPPSAVATRVRVDDRFAAEVVDLVGDVLGRALVAALARHRSTEIVDHDASAPLGQLERVLASEAAAGARDDRNLAVVSDVSHGAGD